MNHHLEIKVLPTLNFVIIEAENINSIAIPALGCGNGGLDWDKVKSMIENHLGHLKDVDIIVFEPN